MTDSFQDDFNFFFFSDASVQFSFFVDFISLIIQSVSDILLS